MSGTDQSKWRTEIAEALAPRLPGNFDGDQRRLEARALSGAAIACLISTQVEWVNQDRKRSIDTLLDVAISAVSPLG